MSKLFNSLDNLRDQESLLDRLLEALDVEYRNRSRDLSDALRQVRARIAAVESNPLGMKDPARLPDALEYEAKLADNRKYGPPLVRRD